MPSAKMVAWIVGLSLATNVAFTAYMAKKGGGAVSTGIRRAA